MNPRIYHLIARLFSSHVWMSLLQLEFKMITILIQASRDCGIGSANRRSEAIAKLHNREGASEWFDACSHPGKGPALSSETG